MNVLKSTQCPYWQHILDFVYILTPTSNYDLNDIFTMSHPQYNIKLYQSVSTSHCQFVEPTKDTTLARQINNIWTFLVITCYNEFLDSECCGGLRVKALTMNHNVPGSHLAEELCCILFLSFIPHFLSSFSC